MDASLVVRLTLGTCGVFGVAKRRNTFALYPLRVHARNSHAQFPESGAIWTQLPVGS